MKVTMKLKEFTTQFIYGNMRVNNEAESIVRENPWKEKEPCQSGNANPTRNIAICSHKISVSLNLELIQEVPENYFGWNSDFGEETHVDSKEDERIYSKQFYLFTQKNHKSFVNKSLLQIKRKIVLLITASRHTGNYNINVTGEKQYLSKCTVYEVQVLDIYQQRENH
uniref:Uncharacterized protein n=1 Tax=Glossina pallidipes TaxID=7398 RepID=A0A1B0A3V5_GLOPL